MDRQLTIAGIMMNRETSQYNQPSRQKENGNGRKNRKPNNQYAGNYQDTIYIQSKPKFKNQKSLTAPVSLRNEDFIQATSKIWLNEEYPNHSLNNDDDSDLWSHIVRIHFRSTEEIKCPICLDLPRVGRVDKCGHMYCLPCLLKYMEMQDGCIKKCALCNQRMVLNRFRRAAVIQTVPYFVGDSITMMLMKRDHEGFVATPIDRSLNRLPDVDSTLSCFSDRLICPKLELESMIAVEVAVLENMLVESQEDNDGRCNIIESSISHVRAEMINVVEMKPSCPKMKISQKKVNYNDVSELSHSHYVYYQEEGGDFVFLCPRTWNFLRKEYFEQEKSMYPLRITGKILDLKRHTVNEEFVRRYRYLRHLFVGSSVYFAEMDVEDLLSGDNRRSYCENRDIQENKRAAEKEQERRQDEARAARDNPRPVLVFSSTSTNEFCPDIINIDDFVPLSASTIPAATNPSGVPPTISYAKMTRQSGDTKWSLPAPDIEDDYSIAGARSNTFNINDYIITKKTKSRKKKNP